jgi:hypothetical protein
MTANPFEFGLRNYKEYCKIPPCKLIAPSINLLLPEMMHSLMETIVLYRKKSNSSQVLKYGKIDMYNINWFSSRIGRQCIFHVASAV